MVTVSPSEEVGERNKIRCSDLFGGDRGVVGRGTAWDRHGVGGVPLATEGGGQWGAVCNFPQTGTVRRLWTSNVRRGSSFLSMAGV